MIDGLFGPYFDGKGHRWADCLAAWRSMEKDLGSPENVLSLISSARPEEALEAEASLIAATRKALGLSPFEPGTGLGCTDLAAKRLGADLIRRSRG